MQAGFYRGLAPLAFFVGARGVCGALGINFEVPSAAGPEWLKTQIAIVGGTLFMNPFANLTTMK
mgnify:CR=1 FL=1